MDFDAVHQTIRDHAQNLAENARNLFRFLSGESSHTRVSPPKVQYEVKEEKKETSWTSSITGLFSRLKGPSNTSETYTDVPDGEMYEEGEVHADLVMVCYHRLLVQNETLLDTIQTRTTKDVMSSDIF